MKYSEMQVGDKVEITDKRTVTISKIDSAQNAYDDQGRMLMDSHPISGNGTREFGLIERPAPPLPTEKGTVVKVSSLASTEPGLWFLTETMTGGYVEWVSASGVRKSPEEFRTFLNARLSRRFEVIR